MSYKTVAESVGLGGFWQPGSKTPMIIALLTRTLEARRDRFETLMLEVVRAAIVYRQKQGRPVSPAEIDRVNGHLLEIGFKFPDLWDPAFKTDLATDGSARAKDRISRKLQEERIRISEVEARHKALADLQGALFSLYELTDRQAAGRRLQGVLTDLFRIGGLEPRSPFRIQGEEIDGSFELVHPAKAWTNAGAREGDALILTKPIGSGVLLNANLKGLVSDDAMDGCLRAITTLNRAAANVMNSPSGAWPTSRASDCPVTRSRWRRRRT